jgi:hypothetical protein
MTHEYCQRTPAALGRDESHRAQVVRRLLCHRRSRPADASESAELRDDTTIYGAESEHDHGSVETP